MRKIFRVLKSFLVIALGSALIAAAISILRSHSLAAVGVTGVGVIAEKLCGVRFQVTYTSLSAGLLVVGFLGLKQGHLSFLKSLCAIVLISWFISLIQVLQLFPSHAAQAAILGGVLLGCGVGLLMNEGASTGGPDTVALLLEDKIPKEYTVLLIDGSIILAGICVVGAYNVFSVLVLPSVYVAIRFVDKIKTAGITGIKEAVISAFDTIEDKVRSVQKVVRNIGNRRDVYPYFRISLPRNTNFAEIGHRIAGKLQANYLNCKGLQEIRLVIEFEDVMR